jgi:hypothetical protein
MHLDRLATYQVMSGASAAKAGWPRQGAIGVVLDDRHAAAPGHLDQRQTPRL